MSTLATSFTSTGIASLNTKKPFTMKFDRLYKEVMKVAETEPSQYQHSGRKHRMTIESCGTLNEEIGKTKMSYLTGRTINCADQYYSKEQRNGFCSQERPMKNFNKGKSTVDSLRQIRKTLLKKTYGFILSNKMFKSPKKTNVHCELKGNNDFIARMKKSFPEYLSPKSSFIPSERPNTQRIGRIKYQLNKL